MAEYLGVEAGVSAALEALAARQQHDPKTGRFTAGNTNAATTLARSEAFWEAVEGLKQEMVRRLSTQLAVDEHSPETLIGSIDAYVEARLLRQAMFRRLVEMGGAVTSKGKTRAIYSAYWKAWTAEMKAAADLGYEPRAKQVDLARTLAEQQR